MHVWLSANAASQIATVTATAMFWSHTFIRLIAQVQVGNERSSGVKGAFEKIAVCVCSASKVRTFLLVFTCSKDLVLGVSNGLGSRLGSGVSWEGNV